MKLAVRIHFRFISWPVLSLALAILAGCSGSGTNGPPQPQPSATPSASPSPLIAPPSGLRYLDNNPRYQVGVAILANLPLYSGNADSFAVSPPLPAGLILDSNTGRITGTPLFSVNQRAYTVTVSNARGSSSAVMQLSVIPAMTLEYPAIPAFYQNVRIAPINPILRNQTRRVQVYRLGVGERLPAGLALDPFTGVISGTPTVPVPHAHFTVTGVADDGREVQTRIRLEVHPQARVEYPPAPELFVGEPLPIWQPAIQNPNGHAVNFNVQPALPNGLMIDWRTGRIYGTPGISFNRNYNVTVTIGVQRIQIPLNIRVLELPRFHYNMGRPLQEGVRLAAPILPIVDHANHGLARFRVQPELPRGLILNQADGRITGTPEIALAPQEFVVRARDGNRRVQARIQLEVRAVPRIELNYPEQQDRLKVGVAVRLNPQVGQRLDARAIFEVDPPLPDGLRLDAQGQIVGVPNRVGPASDHTVTLRMADAVGRANLHFEFELLSSEDLQRAINRHNERLSRLSGRPLALFWDLPNAEFDMNDRFLLNPEVQGLLRDGRVQDVLWIAKSNRSRLYQLLLRQAQGDLLEEDSEEIQKFKDFNTSVRVLEDGIKFCFENKPGLEAVQEIGGANAHAVAADGTRQKNHFLLRYRECKLLSGSAHEINLGEVRAHFKRYQDFGDLAALPHPTGNRRYPDGEEAGANAYLAYRLSVTGRGTEARSEYAAYLVDELLDLQYVPLTVWGGFNFQAGGDDINLTGALQLHVPLDGAENGWAKKADRVKHPMGEFNSPSWFEEVKALAVFGYIIGNPDLYREPVQANGTDVNYFVWNPPDAFKRNFSLSPKFVAIDHSAAFRTSMGGFLQEVGRQPELIGTESQRVFTWRYTVDHGFRMGIFGIDDLERVHQGHAGRSSITHWDSTRMAPEILFRYPIDRGTFPQRLTIRLRDPRIDAQLEEILSRDTDLPEGRGALIDGEIGYVDGDQRLPYFTPNWSLERVRALQAILNGGPQ